MPEEPEDPQSPENEPIEGNVEGTPDAANIEPINVADEMAQSFLEYSMSVII
ncbi:MAG: hypothetical protein AAGJ79_09530 [Verrucomicrobiota bacterium]